MIGISAKVFDLDGARIYDTNRSTDMQNRGGSRRASRVATLDGGVSVYDMGYADSDRDITVEVNNPSIEAIEFAEYITRTYTEVTVTIEDGAYSVVPESHRLNAAGALLLTLRVTEKLS
jgi:hypothetical protein